MNLCQKFEENRISDVLNHSKNLFNFCLSNQSFIAFYAGDLWIMMTYKFVAFSEVIQENYTSNKTMQHVIENRKLWICWRLIHLKEVFGNLNTLIRTPCVFLCKNLKIPKFLNG